MFACQKGELSLMKYLIDQYCNIGAQDIYKKFNLIYTLMVKGKDPRPILGILIDKGCDPNYSDCEGNSV